MNVVVISLVLIGVVGLFEGFFASDLFSKSIKLLEKIFFKVMQTWWRMPLVIIQSGCLFTVLIYWDLALKPFYTPSEWKTLHSILFLSFLAGAMLEILWDSVRSKG